MNTKIRPHLSMLGRYGLLIGIIALSPGLTQVPATDNHVSDRVGLPVVGETATQKQPAWTALEDEPPGMQELDLPPGVSGDWWGVVQEDIHRSEYNLTWQDHTYLKDVPAAYQAPNRAQGLRTYFIPEGIRVIPRTETESAWEWGLRLTSYGYEGELQPVGEAELVVEDNRAEYRRGPLTEWYLNDERGLEQGFTLSAQPGAGKESPGDWIVLRMVLYGDLKASLDDAAREIEFTTEGGVKVLRYDHLQASDANGNELHSRFVLAGDVIDIQVDTSGAEYPINIDPLTTSPYWTAESDQSGASFGNAVGTAGDVNNDGYADVIVGAELYDNGETDEGRAFVYHGGPAGLSTSPDWTAESNQSEAHFGCSVGTAGDVNGDKYDDVIVGAYNYEDGQTDEGRAFVYFGRSTGVSFRVGWFAESDQDDANFGYSVGTAGDVNGDGYADVIIGAPYYDNGQANEGQAYIFHGNPSGLNTSPTWTAEGNGHVAYFGVSVGTAGDVNRDGYADVIIGAENYSNGETSEGRAFVFHGSHLGVLLGPSWTVESDQEFAQFGNSVGTAGDVNGDGYADVIVGAHIYSNGEVGEGRAYVYHGGATGLNANPDWTAESDQSNLNFGNSVGTAGDVNGDGYDDVIIGTDSGWVFVFRGSSTELSANPDWTAESDQVDASFGSSVGSAGDVNGDGYTDVIIGMQYYDNGETDEGRAYVYYGGLDWLNASPNRWVESDQDTALFGNSVGAAGDVNGDGYADVIIGAPYYDNGQMDEGRVFVYYAGWTSIGSSPNWTEESDQVEAFFGNSVSSAGDVNGDGFADVIVGAYWYTNGETKEGRAYVYHGSLTGLSTSPDWIVESNQVEAFLGASVGTAGDVNGDGYADVIVGAFSYDHGQEHEGRAYVYYGSSTGLHTSPDWTAESDQVGAFFGYSTGTAGDVNGDGYADVIVGAQQYDNGEMDEGRVFVYHGSSTGVSTSPDWTAESDQQYASFGYSVGTAGDVNGDGYADVIVGAPGYDDFGEDEGRTFVYHGGSMGLSASPNWTADSDQANASFGASVGTAGDVNGDGYADIIIGVPNYENGEDNEGRVYLYQGGKSGLNSNPYWTAESDQVNAHFGNSVGTVGDINGDGYGDVIVGAYAYDNDQTDEGRAFVYHGSAAGLSASSYWTAESDQVEAWFGVSVGTAGDVNGDGYTDVIIGATRFDNGESGEGRAFVYHGGSTGLSTSPDWTGESNQIGAGFGQSVGTAGDVNGDGYADIIIGAAQYDSDISYVGRVYVYYGSLAGLSDSPDWTVDGDQSLASFGKSVGTAGDVNGDGYPDVIIGAPYYDNGETEEGRVYVYHGGSTGLNTSPDWTAESDQVEAFLGISVSSAGDVNGDGYADVIIGSNNYDNGETDEGRVYVFHGGVTGLSNSPDWTAESDQEEAYFGRSVGSAGDVNGDSFADVIIGAYNFSNGETGEGRCFVYYGGLTGLSTNPDWTAESDQANAGFGFSVGTAGDVNGDGYADIIVGAASYDDWEENEGRAFVYLGGSMGLIDSPNWTADIDQAQAVFGYSVGTAGDVNGDGYADAIVGAYLYDHGETDEGRAFLYYGNGTGGRLVLARQSRVDGTLVHPWGLSDKADSFQVSMQATHPMGRGWVMLHVQGCPTSESFIGGACIGGGSEWWVDTTTSEEGVLLTVTVPNLEPDMLYRWRARLLYAPQTVTPTGIGHPRQPAHGPWRRFQSLAQEADLRTSLIPVPTITNLSPSSITVGEPAFILTVIGTNFVNGVSTVRWNGLDRTTTFVSDTELQAEVSAADIASAGNVSVTVFNTEPGGGMSNSVNFTILEPIPEIDDQQIFLPIIRR